MAIRKSECLDCEIVFVKKGNRICPDCGSSNITAFVPEYDEITEQNIGEQWDEAELRGFHKRARESD